MTDGEVSNPQSVIELAKMNSDTSSVHSFGLGSGCTRDLIIKVAEAGRGSYSFVLESDNLNKKVI